MSLFKSQMFIEEATPPASLDFDKESDAFGPSYGNRVASERLFREPWNPHRRETDACPADDAGSTPDR